MCIRVMGSGEQVVGAKQSISPKSLQYGRNEPAIPGRRPIFADIKARQQSINAYKLIENIDPSLRHFNQYGIGIPLLREASARSKQSKFSAGEELIRSGIISRENFAMTTADYYALSYSQIGPDPSSIATSTGKLMPAPGSTQNQSPQSDLGFSNIVTEYRGWNEKPKIYIAADPSAHEFLGRLVRSDAIDNSQISITTRASLYHSQFVAQSSFHLQNAIRGLARRFPNLSASSVITTGQATALLFLIGLFGLAYFIFPFLTVLGVHLLATTFYLGVTLMRAMMIIPGANIVENSSAPLIHTGITPAHLPTYSILVALYREAGQVDDLVHSLQKINWPRDRLQILLICEADDLQTIEKCRVYQDDERIQTIICPPASPQTKPKALNYALPLVRGEFIVLYDAEDRPHPDQLMEANTKFSANKDIACLQAPLFIHNDRQTWLTKLFAIEYVTQFSLILPVLEKWKSPIPLGGTSNHFRTGILNEIGAWDPYNVTEDADLGIRLSRFGYQCGTLKLPTWEEAPPFLNVWFKQRTRWIKGWLQTFLVHMRNPVQLWRDLGTLKTLQFHLVITSIVISVLIHPWFIASAIYHLLYLGGQSGMNLLNASIIGIDVFNLVGGYSTYFAICWVTLNAKQRRYLNRSILLLPIYWILISLAGWRALFQLWHNPFLWEKTPHGLANSFPK